MEALSEDLRRITETQALLSAIAMSLWMFWGGCLIAGHVADGFIHLLPFLAITVAATPKIRMLFYRQRERLSAATYRRRNDRSVGCSGSLKQILKLREARQPE